MGKRHTTSEPGLSCPKCGADSAPGAWLDRATGAVLPQRWVNVTCPRCRRAWFLRVSEKTLTVGDLDGYPGPCFMPLKSRRVAGLSRGVTRQGFRVTMGTRTWLIPTR